MTHDEQARALLGKLVEELDLTALSISNTTTCNNLITTALQATERRVWEQTFTIVCYMCRRGDKLQKNGYRHLNEMCCLADELRRKAQEPHDLGE